ncbi:MAG: hypothetical protein ACOX2P_04970 [Bacillota bacterium]
MGLLDADLRIKSIIDVPLEKLSELGIDSLIIDVDNTVTEWKGRNVEARAKEWFLSIKEKGFKACLVSNNNSGERIASIARPIRYTFHSQGRKATAQCIYSSSQNP